MAKRVILAHPFERVSGNITRSKQKLVYAENDNPAWNAPNGKQYARNFKPQMVLRYDAGREKTSFTIQTKHAVNNTPVTRLRQAVFGGATAVYQGIAKNPTLLANIFDKYETVKEQYKSFVSYAQKVIQTSLKNKQATFNFGGRVGTPIYVNNPWVAGGTGTDVTISDDTLLKFAEYLCRTAIYVNGKFACGFEGSANNKVTSMISSSFNKLANGETAFFDNARYKNSEMTIEDTLGYKTFKDSEGSGHYVTTPQGSTTAIDTGAVIPAGVWNINALEED